MKFIQSCSKNTFQKVNQKCKLHLSSNSISFIYRAQRHQVKSIFTNKQEEKR